MPSVQAIRCPQKSPSGSSAATAWWTDDDGCIPWFSGVAVRRTRFGNDSSKDRGTASSTEETALLTTLHVLFLRIPTASGPVGRGIGLSACLDQCAWGVSDCEVELFGGTEAGVGAGSCLDGAAQPSPPSWDLETPFLPRAFLVPERTASIYLPWFPAEPCQRSAVVMVMARRLSHSPEPLLG